MVRGGTGEAIRGHIRGGRLIDRVLTSHIDLGDTALRAGIRGRLCLAFVVLHVTDVHNESRKAHEAEHSRGRGHQHVSAAFS